jgi:hypothetical protein
VANRAFLSFLISLASLDLTPALVPPMGFLGRGVEICLSLSVSTLAFCRFWYFLRMLLFLVSFKASLSLTPCNVASDAKANDASLSFELLRSSLNCLLRDAFSFCTLSIADRDVPVPPPGALAADGPDPASDGPGASFGAFCVGLAAPFWKRPPLPLGGAGALV